MCDPWPNDSEDFLRRLRLWRRQAKQFGARAVCRGLPIRTVHQPEFETWVQPISKLMRVETHLKVTRPWTMEKGSSGLTCHLYDKEQIKTFTALQSYAVIAAALVGFFDVFIAFDVVLLSGKYLSSSWLA